MKSSEVLRPTAAVRAALEAAGRKVELRPGAVLFRQGDPGDCLYIIERGSVMLMFDGEKLPKLLEAGDFFGEIAVLSASNRRTATAVVQGEAALLVVSQAALRELEDRQPAVVCALLRETCGYLLSSERALLEDLEVRNRELERTLDYLRRTREELDATELLALTDELTGLYNRRCFGEQMRRLFGQPPTPDRTVALLIVDLDLFKPINDTYGHPIGDLVLRRVGSLLRAAVRKTDLPCRLGGDEFALVLAETREEDARARAIEIHRRLNALEVPLPAGPLQVRASLGGATRADADDVDELTRRADASLYVAKTSGRGQVAWCGALLD